MPSARAVCNSARFYTGSLYEHLKRKDVFLWSQAIAFKALVSVIPLLIIGTGLLGPKLAEVVRDLLPPDQGANLLAFIRKLQAASDTLTIVGGVGLILTGVTLFSTLRAVLANVFVEEWHVHRSTLRGYLFDLRMAGQIGILFVATLAISAGIQAFNLSGSEFLSKYSLDFLWLDRGWRLLVQGLGLLVPIAVTTAIFYQLYYLTPLPHPPRRSVTAGAVFAAVLFEISKFAFTTYASRLGSIGRYSTADPGNLTGVADAFGVIVAFVFWAYYSGLVLILGALVVLLHEARVRDSGSYNENGQRHRPATDE